MNVSPSGQYVYETGDFSVLGVFGTDTLYTSGEQFFIASWRACDSNIETGTCIISNDLEVKVYPNPSNGTFNVSLLNINEKCHVEIYNMIGELVYTEIYSCPNSYTMNLYREPNGVYLYRVLKEDGSLLGEGKIVIEK